jgi:hypothetical protein
LFKVILPDNLGCTLPSVRNKVDFPIPLMPTIAASSPVTREKLISLATQDCCFLLE